MPAEKSAAFAEFLKQQASVQDSQFKPGSIIEGTVSAVKGDDVFVDIGYKSEGVVSLDEFADKEAVKPGLKFQVMLRDLENDKTGMVVLSKKAADDQIRWEKVLAQYTEGCVVNGTIRSQVRGGLLVDIDGVEAFLPGSQVDVMSVRDLAPYIGQTFDFKVIKISNERKNIIISRRELIEGTMAEKKAALLASLQKGEIRKGRVKNITDFGAFIDLDGIDGLLHITDMSWGRIKHPSEMLKVGQELDVMVLDVDQEKERISLGLKQTTENPWSTISEQFPVGSRVQGKVVNLDAVRCVRRARRRHRRHDPRDGPLLDASSGASVGVPPEGPGSRGDRARRQPEGAAHLARPQAGPDRSVGGHRLQVRGRCDHQGQGVEGRLLWRVRGA